MTGIEQLQGQNRINAQLLVERREESAPSPVTPHKFPTAAKVLCAIFTLGIGNIILAVAEHRAEVRAKDLARDVVGLKEMLKDLPSGEERTIRLGGESVTVLSPDDHAPLQVTIDGESFASPFTAKALAARLENEIIQNEGLYGKDAQIEVLSSHWDGTLEVSDETSRMRDLSQKLLEAKFGIGPLELTGVSTNWLFSMALSAASGQILNASDIRDQIALVQNSQRINGEEALELLENLERARTNAPEHVETAAPIGESSGVHPAPDGVEPPAEVRVRKLAADLILNERTWMVDRLQEKPGESLRATLIEHADTIAECLLHPELLSALPKELTAPVEDFIAAYRSSLPLIAAAASAGEVARLVRTTAQALPAEQLVEFEALRDEKVMQACGMVQIKILEAFAEITKTATSTGTPETAGTTTTTTTTATEGTAPEGADGAPQPTDGTQPGNEVQEMQAPAPRTLDERLAGSAMDITSDGYGKFMQKVIQNYFVHMPSIDQRAMIASLLRNAPADAGPGEMMGALLKGAGPIMQKMLQGFNVETMDPAFREALADMKSSLAPIPDAVVEAHLLNMVERSHGRIASITVEKSLGAASVGQALLCRMTLATGEEKEVVVKILRPDAKNRAEREAEVFRYAAKQVSGMELTFEGQLARIMDELDLTIEARNIREGRVYNSAPDPEDPEAPLPIQSMSLNDLVEPTASTLVLEKAPGTTIDKYLAGIDERLGQALEDIIAKDPDGKPITHEVANDGADPIAGAGTRILTRRLPVAQLTERFEALGALYAEVADKTRLLTQFASKWVTEGIYGGGFYHGDLHAGNIMVGGNTLTVIDFGNATQLSDHDQTEITRMAASAAAQDAPTFMKGFANLLSPAGRERFEAKKATVRSTLEEIFALGGKEDTGKRIAVALTELQKLGLELPAAIFNFSQCQMRLQGAIDNMRSELERIKVAMMDVTGTLRTGGQGSSSLDPVGFGLHASDRTDREFSNTLRSALTGASREMLEAASTILEDIFKNGPESGQWKNMAAAMDGYRERFEEWKSLKDAEDRGEPPRDAEAPTSDDLLKDFVRTYIDEQTGLLGRINDAWTKVMTTHTDDFFTCMANVIATNLRASVNRLGFFTARRYGSILA